ncbi:MAG: pyruvate dehydrogenase [Planctomycetota bacterium]|nr:MAG: pyruvate dehydrogenase [Planctomycetota bacterium]
MSTTTAPRTDTALLHSIAERAFAQMVTQIWLANNRKDKRAGDPKVGGHPAACASSLHILGALHLAVRDVQDYVCCKPHASPVDHAYHHLLRLFRRPDVPGIPSTPANLEWLGDEEAKRLMATLRKFPEPLSEPVFQSYHARSDPDSFHMLPSGSVGIPPVVSVYLALAHRYARDHKYHVPPKAHYWSLIGDSEFREGSLFEAIPDVAERQLGNVTWIVDYNRQNLDGTRIPNERALRSRDCDRIQLTGEANGWKVIQVRHGRFREELFQRPGGDELRVLLESELSDYALQLMLFKRDANHARKHCLKFHAKVRKVLDTLDDAELLRALTDLGGHDMGLLCDALRESKQHPDTPYLLVVHTIKGWSLKCFADPANHSTLPTEAEVREILEARGLSWEDPFAHFSHDSAEGSYLAQRGARFRAGIAEHLELRAVNRARARERVDSVGGLPETLDIDLSLYPQAHTQWMWGQLAAKLVRISTFGAGGPALGDKQEKPLSEDEKRWRAAAEYVLTLSPDVGTSTNIAPAMDSRVYGPNVEGNVEEFDARHPELHTTNAAWTRHIRFEIAEANCMSAVGSFGKMAHYTGQPFFPVMTVYDFFIKRALDQLYYNLYWGAEFVIIGTPSGVTLSSEGAQHSWKSDLQIPNLITWEPVFAIEMDWILSDAIRRHMLDENEGRRGVLIRAVTKSLRQGLLLEHVRRHAASKRALPSEAKLKPAGAGADWDAAAHGAVVDESTLEPLPDAELYAKLRRDCLAGGYYLVDWRGYAGYEPGDNVVHVFAMGALALEALEASKLLLELGIFANVIAVASPELLLGILGEHDQYRHLTEGLAVDGDLCLSPSGSGPKRSIDVESAIDLVGLAGRRVPIVAVCDGEAGLLDNIGSIVGVKQTTLAVRKFSKCGRPDQVFAYQHIDAQSIVEACGKALSETALEQVRVSGSVARTLGGAPQRPRVEWRELWPRGE